MSTLTVSELPNRWNSRSCSTRSSLALQIDRQFADFVQKQRAALGLLEAADAVLKGSRECAAHVAEQFALQQALRQRAAIHRHHWSATPLPGHVQRARRQFLAGSGFAGDQHRGAAARHQTDDVLQLPHLVAPAHQHPLPIFAVRLPPTVPTIAQPPVFDHLVDQPEAVFIRREESDTPPDAPAGRLRLPRCRIPNQYGNSGSSPLDRFQQVRPTATPDREVRALSLRNRLTAKRVERLPEPPGFRRFQTAGRCAQSGFRQFRLRADP